MKTLGLTSPAWDLYVDELKNIGVVEGNTRLAQDVASSVRVFKGECSFDIQRGVEYDKPDEVRSTLQSDIKEQVDLIEGVQESVVLFDELKDRTLKPSIYVINEENEQIVVE